MPSLLSPTSEHRLLGIMLLLLHSALWWDFPGAISRSLMLAHLGVFLIWQPLWSRERRLDWRALLTFVLITVGFAIWIGWWLIAFWLVLLIGLVGGRIPARPADRTAYIIAGFFLVFELLVGVVPPMFAVPSFSGEVVEPLAYGLFLVPVSLLFIPSPEPDTGGSRAVDFLYGLTVALLVVILVLGSLLAMYHQGVEYPVALFETVVGIALFLLALSWVWTPLAGFSGLGQLWTRYLLNIGTPFEQWLAEVSRLAAERRSPEQFLGAAFGRLVALPWVRGCRWETAAASGTHGARTAHHLDIEGRDIRVRIFTGHRVSTALKLHGQLLVQLVSDFHEAKRREIELAQKAHLQAVHETGARVTHDIKNLLQSLYALAMAVQSDADGRPEELHRLLRQQLPHLTQRLQLALDKLQAPRPTPARQARLAAWWEALEQRHAGDAIAFDARIARDLEVPAEMLDSVVENLLENARFKRQSEPDLTVRVALRSDDGGLVLRISDTGSGLDPELARILLRGPVKSASGLGIGLYQSSRQAAELGYELRLREWREGNVCFELRGPGTPPPAAGGLPHARREAAS